MSFSKNQTRVFVNVRIQKFANYFLCTKSKFASKITQQKESQKGKTMAKTQKNTKKISFYLFLVINTKVVHYKNNNK